MEIPSHFYVDRMQDGAVGGITWLVHLNVIQVLETLLFIQLDVLRVARVVILNSFRLLK